MLTELINSVNSDMSALNLMIEKADIIIDYTYNQYLIEERQNNLSAITEEVSLDHPEGKASEGFIGRASKITKKLIDSLISAIKSIFLKIRNAIEDMKFKSMVKKAEKQAKENAKVKNKTVEAYDPSKELKVIAWYKDFLNKMHAKAKAGKAEEVENEISSESENYDKKLKAAKIAAAVTVTVAAAITMLKKYTPSFSTKNEEAIIKDANLNENFEGKSPEFANAVIRIQKEMIKAVKDEASAISKAMTTAISAVRDGIVGTTEIKVDDTSAKEDIKSAMESSDDVDIDLITNDIINEAEETINITSSLIDSFEESTNHLDLNTLSPEEFLILYEADLLGEDTTEDDTDFIKEYLESDDINVAKYLVENALN